jgi:hypothetical protein
LRHHLEQASVGWGGLRCLLHITTAVLCRGVTAAAVSGWCGLVWLCSLLRPAFALGAREGLSSYTMQQEQPKGQVRHRRQAVVLQCGQVVST